MSAVWATVCMKWGTARMGRDPKTSVLNGNNQIHAVPNVFVTDGAMYDFGIECQSFDNVYGVDSAGG